MGLSGSNINKVLQKKAFFIFWKTETPKKFFMFQETETLKKLFIFQETELSYISGKAYSEPSLFRTLTYLEPEAYS